ncbi:MAG: Lrp/AsnC family transcriptional regulator [Thermoplasmatota archaeon]
MDELDRRLIEALMADGRAHVSTLAHRLEVPRSTVQERLKRLQERGIITSFRPMLDHAQLGRPVQAHILARFTSGAGIGQREVAARLAAIPGVEEVHVASGEWDLILRVRGKDLEDIADLVLDHIRAVPGIERTLTCSSFHVAEGVGAPLLV